MASRGRKDSEYADIYKLKSGTSDAKNKRLQRRSLDWKNQRDDEVNKRRNLVNLSPLQELSQNTTDTSYKDKTPVKTSSKDANLRQKLAKWKQEKEMKKKAQEKSKKPTFKVLHMEHKDKEMFSAKSSSTHKKPLFHTESTQKPKSTKLTTVSATKPSATTTKSTATTSKPTATTKPQKTVSTHNVQPAKTVCKPQTGKSSETTKSQKVINSTEPFKKPTAAYTTRSTVPQKTTQKPVNTNKRDVNARAKSSQPFSHQSQQKQRGKEKNPAKVNVNLAKVSMHRGDSFAPDDFTFSVPSNLTSFSFRPLSPSSAAAFLYPNQYDPNSASFIGTVPKRSSTPKSAEAAKLKAEEKDTVTDINQSYTTDKTLSNGGDVSDKENSLITTASGTRRSKRLQSTNTAKKDIKQSDSGFDSVLQKDSKMVNATDEAPKRITRSTRRSESVRDRSSSKRRHETSEKPGNANEAEERIPKRRRKSVSAQVQIKVQVEVHKSETDGDDQCSEPLSDSESVISSNIVTQSDTDVESARIEAESVIHNEPACQFEKSVIDSDIEHVEQEKTSKNVCTNEDNSDITSQSDYDSAQGSDNQSKRKTRNSRKSRTVETESIESVVESEKNQVLMETDSVETSVQKEVKSQIDESTVKTSIATDELHIVQKAEDAQGSDIQVQKAEDTQGSDIQDSVPQGKRRKSMRRSLSVSMNNIENKTPISARRTSKKSVSIQNNETTVIPNKEANDTCTPTRRMTRNSRKSMSAVEGFLIPNDDVKVLSARSTAKKRRKTTHDGEPMKSPEEWVKLLYKSPMIEMTRRTPKPKSPEERDPATILNFDDLDESLSMGKLPPCVFDDEPEHIVKQDVNMEAETEKNTESVHTGSEEPNSRLEQNSQDEEHNVPYFRKLLQTETAKLNKFSDMWENINTACTDLTEEVRGQIRTCIGQAQLLIAQRFKQFSGLVDNCEFNTGEKETTCTDLQGFWDMIYYQVVDVHTKFEELQKLKDNNWVNDNPAPVKKIVKKKIGTKTGEIKPKVKSKFAEFRMQMKKQKESSVKVFDAGFFKVSSPVKTPPQHCEGGSPKAKSTYQEQEMATSTCTTGSKETSSTEKKPLQELLTVGAYTSPIITPSKRKSYLPAVPSPLLKDCTPQPRIKRRSSIKKILSEPESNTCTTELTEVKENRLPSSPVCNDSTVSLAERTTKSAIKKPVRRSLRTRKSVSFLDSVQSYGSPSSESTNHTESQPQESTDQDDLFSIYLQPSNIRLSLAPQKSILETHFGEDSFSDETESAIGNENYPSSDKKESRRRHSSLKHLPSKERRRSTRSSLSLPSPISEQPLMSPAANTDTDSNKSVFSPPNNPSVKEGRFSTLNIGFTPVCRKTRPSLLYTPPEEGNTSVTQTQNVPTGTLISFSP